MNRLLIIMTILTGQAAAEIQPLWALYGKQVGKELARWSDTFDRAEHVRTKASREFYRIIDKAGKPSGTLVLTTAPGRFERFDLMVVMDASGKINLIRILKYRSQFGSEITNKSWLSQFYTQPVPKFELHKNIDAISGATFSSNGLVEEINTVVEEMRKRGGEREGEEK